MALLTKRRAFSTKLMEQEQESPEVGYVAIGELHYDYLHWIEGRAYGYQRPIDEPKVEKRVAEFDARLIGVITVSRRADGSLWVLDGQHRAAVMGKLGHSVILAAVYSGLTADAEAAIYYRLNTDRKNPNQWNTFGARASSGDRRALAVIALAAECGFRIGTADRSMNSIAAVNVLERIYDEDPHLLRMTLQKIGEYWPSGLHARDGVFIEGLARFIFTWDGRYIDSVGAEIDWKRAAEKFATVDDKTIVKRAGALHVEHGMQLGATVYALVFRDIYNGNAKFVRRLEGGVARPHRSGIRRVSRGKNR